jgi:hypothetical protein
MEDQLQKELEAARASLAIVTEEMGRKFGAEVTARTLLGCAMGLLINIFGLGGMKSYMVKFTSEIIGPGEEETENHLDN